MATVQLSPPTAPFRKIKNPGESITINTAGKILVLPTGNSTILPNFNEYALNSNRLTIAESPFGGLKGAGSPDYAVGTLFTPTDGVYLTDINGNNSTKTLTAGKLKEVSSLTVDSNAKTITEEFVVVNTSLPSNLTPIDPCNDVANWVIREGSGVITTADNKIILTGNASSSGVHRLSKVFSITNASGFITFKIRNTQNANMSFVVYSDVAGSAIYKYWSSSRFPILANTDYTFVLPTNAPAGTGSTSNPDGITGAYEPAKIYRIVIGVVGTVNSSLNTLTVSSLNMEAGKPAFVEIDVPNNLNTDYSLTLQCWTGAAYETCRVCRLDSTFSDVSSTPANVKFLDATKLDDVYGSTLGRAVFPKGVSAATVTGSTGTMTFSGNKGTSRRIGLMVMLAPSDSGRTNFNKIRMKTILKYTDNDKNTIFDFSGNRQNGTILGTALKSVTGWVFDGDASGKISIPAITLSKLDSKIELTFKGGSTDTNPRAIVGRAGSQYYSYVSLKGSNRAIEGESNTNGNYFPIIILPVGNVFRTVSLTFLNDNVTVTDGTSTQSGTITNDLTLDLIGNTFNGTATNLPFIGTISEIKMWNSGVLVRHYKCTINNMGATSYEFEDSTNASYGLQNLVKPWIALYDPSGNYIDFVLFTHRPKNLIRKRDDTGNIYELVLYPGNGSIYRGRITNALLTTDSNSNLIPDCLESAIEGSVTKFLSSYGMVI